MRRVVMMFRCCAVADVAVAVVGQHFQPRAGRQPLVGGQLRLAGDPQAGVNVQRSGRGY